MPGLAIAVVTDLPSKAGAEFDQVIECTTPPRYSFFDKVLALQDSPFEDTLFLDADTVVCDSCLEAFDLLERFDLAIAHDSSRLGASVDCTDAFVELNTGVLFFRRTDAVRRLFGRWLEAYRLGDERAPGERHDQPFLRAELFQSDVRFYVLTPEYNLTLWHPGFVGSRGRVKVVHGKWHLERVAALVNETERARLVLPSIRWSTREELVLLSPDGPLVQQAARIAAIYLGLRTVTWPNFVRRVRNSIRRDPP